MKDFKFILFTERVFKNKDVFKLAHAYDYLCAIAYIYSDTSYEKAWRPLSERIFNDLLMYDSGKTNEITNLHEYISLMRGVLSKIQIHDMLIEEANAFLA